MKRVIFLACLCATSFLCLGQRMSTGVLLDTMPDVHYIDVYGVDKGFMFDKDVVPIVDYGQKVKMKKGAYLVDENNKALEFESVMGILNYLYGKGWEIVESFAVSHGTGGSVYHHILQRKK